MRVLVVEDERTLARTLRTREADGRCSSTTPPWSSQISPSAA